MAPENIGLYYATTFAWVLERARPLDKPVPYKHHAGAVIWVRLPPAVAVGVLGQSGSASSRRPTVADQNGMSSSSWTGDGSSGSARGSNSSR